MLYRDNLNIKAWNIKILRLVNDQGLFVLGWQRYAPAYLRCWSQVIEYRTAVPGSSTCRQREASAPSGHMTSQLIISTSAWPATVYKSAHRLQEQNEESRMIYSGIWKFYDYVRTVTLIFTSSRLLVRVLSVGLDNCVRTKNRPADRLACNLLTAELTSRSFTYFLTQSVTN